MKLGLRLRLVVAILPLFLAVGVLGALGVSAQLQLIATGGAAVLAVLAVLALTVPFERLRVAAEEALRQAPDVDSRAVAVSMQGRPLDGTGEIANTIWVLMDRLTHSHANEVERNRQYSDALDRVAKSLTAITEENRKPLPPVQLPSPWADRTQAAQAAIEHTGRLMAYAFRRVQTFNAILNELPDGVIVCDEKLKIVYANTLANRLCPKIEQEPNAHLSQCFAKAAGTSSTDPDSPVPIDGPQVVEWVTQSRGGQCVAQTNDDHPTTVAVRQLSTPISKFLKGYKVLEVRDIAGEIGEAEAARHRHRRDVGHRLCLLVNSEATPALEAVRTQAGLLAQTAKQAGQRDRFLPKVSRLLEELGRQEMVVTLLGWLGQLNKTQSSVQDTVEVRLRDVADTVAEKMQAMYAERTNTLDITGDGGWLVADEDWLTVLVTGLLMHANHAVEQNTIRLELGRRSGAVGQKEQAEIVVRYAGPAISPELAADTKEPFGRMHSTALAASGPGGFPLGLAVAARLAKLMGGELHFDRATDQVFLRVLLPTRANDTPAPRMVTVDLNAHEPQFESTDMLGGWEIGGKVVPSLKDTSDPEVTGRLPMPEEEQDVPMLIDDTVGGWFGGSQE